MDPNNKCHTISYSDRNSRGKFSMAYIDLGIIFMEVKRLLNTSLFHIMVQNNGWY